jgi:hypothetical protein
VIQVETNDPADATNRNDIMVRLGHIAKALGSGDFDIPMSVHDTDRPEAQEMKRLQKNIQYSFEETPRGDVLLFHPRIRRPSKQSTDF